MICKTCAEAGDLQAKLPTYQRRTTRAHQLLKVKALHAICKGRSAYHDADRHSSAGCTCQHRTPSVTQV